ncbi:MAG: aminotransferase class I/II-fold pyridoxal phosphate-dependent enzyme [Deltaproteobacteria bacterium]|nr:aminotransferase class I/II-fold pyridoxal phosphate-dependent enzyme [Deltaproteobacteria bacterium]MBL7216412.1 aminotransferase class I/II-fold pyridoxal phosphate-dependent enzyme [Desulfobacteraceae bacterium]
MNNSVSKRIFLSPPHMSGEELRFIEDAFESNYIAPLGPMVDAFERELAEYTGIRYCVALSSGTAAMHLALRGLGIGSGDEVFASSLTFIGSVTPIVFEGATPVFIDCDRASWNMDPDLLEEELERCDRIGRLPRAVVPTDLYGQCCNLGRIVEICDGYGVPVICDSAEALGAKRMVHSAEDGRRRSEVGGRTSDLWLHAGKGAKAAVFSFNGNKIITTSGGGMLASDDGEFIEEARFLSQQARDVAPHYEHSQIGYNYRMSNILAAIGRGQLKVLDERVKRKREIFDYYREALEGVSGIRFMPEAPHGRSNRWLTVILITPEAFGTDRETVRLALEAENIEARPVWKPMHLQPVFQVERLKAQGSRRKAKQDKKRFRARVVGGTSRGQRSEVGGQQEKQKYPARVVGGTVAEDLFDRGLCLPSGTGMNEEDLDRVVKMVLKSRTQVKRQ